MYQEFVGSRVTIVVSSRSENLLEYVGTLTDETEDAVVLTNVKISHLLLNFQKGIFGDNMYKYRDNIAKIVINKKYIISCDVS